MDSWSREPYAQLGSVEPAEACNHTCVGVSMLGGACVGHEWEEPEDVPFRWKTWSLKSMVDR